MGHENSFLLGIASVGIFIVRDCFGAGFSTGIVIVWVSSSLAAS